METELQKMEKTAKDINAQYLKKLQMLSSEFKSKLIVINESSNDTKLANVLKKRMEALNLEHRSDLDKQQKKYEDIIMNLRKELANSEEKLKNLSNTKKNLNNLVDKSNPQPRKKRKLE